MSVADSLNCLELYKVKIKSLTTGTRSWCFSLPSPHVLIFFKLEDNCFIISYWFLTDECIQKLWYIYAMEYHSAIKKNAFE